MSLLGLTLGGGAARELAPDPYAAGQPLAPNPYVEPESMPDALALAPSPYRRPHARRHLRPGVLPLAAMPYASSAPRAERHQALFSPAALAPSPYEMPQRELAPLPY